MPPVFYGAQGGSHWGFSLLVDADGAGECVRVSIELRDQTRDGALLGSFDGGVRANVVAEGVRTAQIVLIPTGPIDGRVMVIARAYGAETDAVLCLEGSSCVLPDAGPLDAL